MVARTGTDQSAVVHERSVASRLTTTATPPMLEIRRRVSPAGRVRTRDWQIRVLIGGSMHHLIRALAIAHIEDLHRDAAPRQTIRLARRVKHAPHVAEAYREVLRMLSKTGGNLARVRLESAASDQAARTCTRRLADGSVGARHRSSSWDRGQLFRHWTDPAIRDHLPAQGPRLP